MRALLFIFAAVLSIGVLNACAAPFSMATDAPTAAANTAVPLPEGFVSYDTDEMSIFIPEDWTPITLSGRDKQDIIEDIKKELPGIYALAKTEDMFDGTYMVAFNTNSARPELTDNMRIDRHPSEGMTDLALRLVADDVADGLQKQGFAIVAIDRDLEINGLAAIRLVVETTPSLPSFDIIPTMSFQYYILDEEYVWALTYTITAEQATLMRPIITQSAESFTRIYP